MKHPNDSWITFLTWNADGARPVVVKMAEFVGEELVTIEGPAGRVVDEIVVGWRHGSLVRRLSSDNNRNGK